MEELDRFGTDTLVTRVTNDINQLQIAVSMLIRLVVRAPFVSIGCVAAAMMLDLNCPCHYHRVLSSSSFWRRSCLRLSRSIGGPRRLDDIGGVVRENFSGLRVIRGVRKKQGRNRQIQRLS
jgi:ATP-binding cassette subfamily B protein